MMLISLCIPCGNRLHDLKRALPSWMAAANASPPVEISVLDYNSDDGLGEFVREAWGLLALAEGNELVYHRYIGRDHYHLAHAYNLAVRASSGEYVTVMGADAVLEEDFIVEARRLIAKGYAWMRGPRFKGILVIQRQEFMAAGGYDERFEFYGGEDKDLELRLQRRCAKFGLMPDGLVRVLRTPNPRKVANYRLQMTKREMMRRGSRIRTQNVAEGVLVANEGTAWGSWD
jgi:glycosyltransferase involved in cell wall biosynthesis